MKKQYKCICQNCGSMFTTKQCRVYCDKCYHHGKAMSAADELESIPVCETVQAIPISQIKEVAKQRGCNPKSIQVVLNKRGYKAITVYVKET